MDLHPTELSRRHSMTPTDFKQLQDLIDNYCSQPIKEVLVELSESGMLKMENCYKNSSAQINYSGYKLLMQNYIEADIPEDLLKNMFQDFFSSSWNFSCKTDGDSREMRLATKHPLKSAAKRETLTEFVRRLQDISKVVLSPICSSDGDEADYPFGEEDAEVINVKELVCCLSLLEAGSPEDKLEFVFKIYDTDENGFLDAEELEHIVDQMTSLANNLEWDVNELKPILQRMIVNIDTNADGKVSLSEWKNAGLTTVPLLALLGMGTRDDGCHKFIMKHFKRPTFCNQCRRLLFGLRKQGLSCIYCKFTVHEQCAELEVLHGCIMTYCSRNSTSQEINAHHWVEGNFTSRCSQCNKSITNMTGLSGLRCRWCQRTVHDSCQPTVDVECDFGELRCHVLQPFSLCSPNPSCAVDLQIKPIEGVCPLLVLINQKSGGRQGSRLMRVFQYLLNPRQVFDLGKGGPGPGLKFFKDVNFRILCCGGDGTVGWLLEEMDKINFSHHPSVAILPLGTGNDLARCLGWGGGYRKEDLKEILKLIERSRTVKMDRWRLDVTTLPDFSIDDSICKHKIPNNIMNNYFSIGIDASIALRFHNMREKHPEKFSSRTRNKLWYFEFGTIETLRSKFKNLQENVEIECDDVPLNIPDGMTLECIAVLNISSIYGGSDLWGNDAHRKEDVLGTGYPELSSRSSDVLRDFDLAKVEQDLGDEKLEVVGLESCIHLAQVKSGIQRGRRLCQCSKVTIRTKQKFPMQIDGEPWIQGPSQIVITHHNRASMLMSPVHSNR